MHLLGSSWDGWTPPESPGTCWSCGRAPWWTPPGLHRTCSLPSGRTAPWCCCYQQSHPWCSGPDAPPCRRNALQKNTNEGKKRFYKSLCMGFFGVFFTCSWLSHVECKHSLCLHGSVQGKWTGPDYILASHLSAGTEEALLGMEVNNCRHLRNRKKGFKHYKKAVEFPLSKEV